VYADGEKLGIDTTQMLLFEKVDVLPDDVQQILNMVIMP
jgi:hypothetical protein